MASYEQEVAIEVGALIVGAAQPFVLRQYVDTKFGAVIPQLGVYGTPSALAGIIAGGGATALALVGMFTGKGLKDPMHQKLALAYGVPALTGSLIMASLTQTTAAASAQGVFRPNAGPQPVGNQSPVAKNYASLSPSQRQQMSVL
jgi:hypothetical protein